MKKQQLELTPNGKRRYASPRLHITPLRSRAVMMDGTNNSYNETEDVQRDDEYDIENGYYNF